MNINIWDKDQALLFNSLIKLGVNFFTGVPDSTLKQFIYNINLYEYPHIIAVHESQAIAIGVGAMLGSKKACVYMQNSGLGNIVNPVTSLCYPFDIFPYLVIGHRHTLPQHKLMGEIDEQLLKLLKYKKVFLVCGDNNVK